MMEHIADYLGTDVVQVKQANLYRDGQYTFSGDVMSDAHISDMYTSELCAPSARTKNARGKSVFGAEASKRRTTDFAHQSISNAPAFNPSQPESLAACLVWQWARAKSLLSRQLSD